MNMITTYWAKRRARIKRAKLVKDIEGSRLRLVKTMNDLRIWIGLPLVQGSSVLALFNKPMLFYWITLEVGLFVYLITSIGLYFEARRTAKMTKVKFDNRLGSTKAAVKSTAEKRRSEIAYIIGNFMGLVFVGSNIYRALIA
jgi:hypothetical protein